ncbi:META domain-containing protein [Fulvivirga sp. 29W222]|uniref:META domain-containing protein n=1 Tax=Fulvivirga marina TaxID=2494733 RepID=A0A937G0D7_9BACT|nr:META domain-containing protein [Fulvivirga marina]MBL6447675.1 META domain-containing protein [Fulvivirga marina]
MKNILIILVLFASCKGAKPQDGQKSETENMKKQLSKSWSIISIGGESLKGYKFTKKAPELILDLEDKKLSGFGGCNMLSGTVDFSENHLNFGVISSSRMICPDIEIEQSLLKLLSNQSYAYEIGHDQLILTGASGSEIIMKGN